MINQRVDHLQDRRGTPPQLTVVTLTLNEHERLSSTCNSVAGQIDCSIEHLVINGGSALSDIESVGPLLTRRVIDSPPQGIYSAMNLGLASASGEAIMFIHSGDRFYRPDSALRAVRLVHQAEWGYGSLLSRRGSHLRIRKAIPVSRAALAFGLTYVPHPSTVMRTEFLRQLGGFDNHLGLAADQLAILKATLRSRPVRTREVLAVHLEDGQSADRDPDVIASEYRAVRQALGTSVLGSPYLDERLARLTCVARRLRRKVRTSTGTIEVRS